MALLNFRFWNLIFRDFKVGWGILWTCNHLWCLLLSDKYLQQRQCMEIDFYIKPSYWWGFPWFSSSLKSVLSLVAFNSCPLCVVFFFFFKIFCPSFSSVFLNLIKIFFANILHVFGIVPLCTVSFCVSYFKSQVFLFFFSPCLTGGGE